MDAAVVAIRFGDRRDHLLPAVSSLRRTRQIMSSIPQLPATEIRAPAGAVRRRWLYLILIVTLLFVLMPFLFWQATWFGRPLTDAQIGKNLADSEHPRKAQHALSQRAGGMDNRKMGVRASARRWYPQVIA